MRTPEPIYRALDTAFLRVCVLPAARARDTWVDVDPGDPDGDDSLRKLVRTLVEDPVVREAVEIASPSLGDVLARIDADAPLSHAQLRRAALAVTKYVLRMSTRATPFGIMAGVAIADLGVPAAGAAARIGTDHRRGVRPDMEWLDAVLGDAGVPQEVHGTRRVVANNVCFLRGERLVNPYPPVERGTDSPNREVSIRATSAVRAVLDLAGTAPTIEELVTSLCQRYPTHARTQVDAMVEALVTQAFLVTDYRPTALSTDPLAHLTRVSGTGVAGVEDLSAGIRDYADTRVGDGLPAWRHLRETATAMHAGSQLVQVDLRTDADVRLPEAVAREIEAAADALYRAGMVDIEPERLVEYHEAFLERYGPHARVPVKRLLDEEFGLGAPIGYQFPPSGRAARHHHRSRHRAVLERWLQQAMLDGTEEIVLDDDRLAELRTDTEPGTGTDLRTGVDLPVPGGYEACFQLVAASIGAAAAGDFELIASRFAGSPRPLASFGRFAYLFGDQDAQLRRMAAQATGTAIRAQLDFHVTSARLANVTGQPALAGRRLPVGTFHDQPSDLDLDDVAVTADHRRLWLVSLSTGEEIEPVCYSMINLSISAGNVVRFLKEIGLSGRRSPWWDWGELKTMPYLPRVRYGRTVLTVARWQVPAALVATVLPDSEWDGMLAAWRLAWRVPDRVEMTTGDNRVELNLDYLLHRRVLRAALQRGEEVTLFEALATDRGTEWLAGYASEVVVPLVVRSPEPPAEQVDRPSVAYLPETRYRPGGQWLHVKLYARADAHDWLLTGPVAGFVGDLPDEVDRWFFIRYRDPVDHLRLRFHGDPKWLNSELLPRVHAFFGGVCTTGYARAFTLDEYVPETMRYGGPDAIEAAERAFCADSLAALDLLRLGRNRPVPDHPASLAALNVADIIARTHGDGWQEWLLDAIERSATVRLSGGTRQVLVQALDAEDRWGELRTHPGGEHLAQAWERRGPALADYGTRLRGTDPALRAMALKGLVHMAYNRAYGIDPAGESRAMATARAAVDAVRNRRKHLS